MSLSKIALFVFGLATVIVAGSVDVNAAGRRNGIGEGFNSYHYTQGTGALVRSAEDVLFERAKNGPY
jgi:hypothetical protein